MNLFQQLLTCGLRLYQIVISPVLTSLFAPLGFGCRYEPTCSHYAIEAVRVHGACRGSYLAGRRLCRCHPWAGFGLDPVPPKSSSVETVLTPLISSRNGS